MHAIEKKYGAIKMIGRLGDAPPKPTDQGYPAYVLTVTSEYRTNPRKKKGSSGGQIILG